MKLNGQKLEGPNVVDIVIPRGNGSAIAFKAQAVLETTSFTATCPEPVPPLKRAAGSDRDTPWLDNQDYLLKKRKHALYWFAWMVIESLKATEGLVWDTVKESEPETWLGYEAELKAAGFSVAEISLIVGKVMEANCLSESRLKEAHDSFLAEREAKQQQSSSQAAGVTGTQSGEPASG